MANTPVISIDLDDSKFRAFQEIFEQFQDKLAEMPETWKKANTSILKNNKGLKGQQNFLANAALHAQAMANELKKASAAQASLGKHTRGSVAQMKKLAAETHKVSLSLFKVGKFLFKWGALGAGMGLAGLFGFGGLAESAVRTQGAARGMGLSQGQLRSFRTNWSRYMDEGVLGSITGAQGDMSKWAWLSMATGTPISALNNTSSARLAMNMAGRVREWWQNTPAAQRTQQSAQAMAFQQSGLSWEQIVKLGHMTSAEYQAARAGYAADKNKFGVGGKATDAMWNFLRQVKEAGQSIETNLIRRLSGLGVSASAFIKAMEDDANILIKGVLTKQNVQNFADGMQHLAKFLGSAQFKSDVSEFASALMGVMHVVIKVARKFGLIETPKQTILGKPTASPYRGGPFDRVREWRQLNYLADMDRKHGLPAGTLEGIWGQESSFGRNLKSPAGALGPMGFMPATWKQWGRGSPMSLGASGEASGAYMGFLLKHYHGNMNRALAAYNWGPGNLDKDIAMHGRDWRRFAPMETQNYAAGVARHAAAAGVKVTIVNQTSARVERQANALSH